MVLVSMSIAMVLCIIKELLNVKEIELGMLHFF